LTIVVPPDPTATTSSSVKTPDQQSSGLSAFLVENVQGDPETTKPTAEGYIEIEYPH
jgi:hypothetical protein